MSSLDAMFLGYSSTTCFCFPEGKDIRHRMAFKTEIVDMKFSADDAFLE
jgi:hypothetical protein